MSATEPRLPDGDKSAHSLHRLVILHEPKISVRHAEAGAVEVMLDDWPYVRINYDYRYTDNASRMWLAKEVARLLQDNEKVRGA